MKEDIAIVGMDCRYPGADNIEQYWENILSLRQQFRRIPDKRLNLDDYFSPDKSKVDHTYSQKASVLYGYNFDRVKYRVAKSTFEQTDLAHWLALDVAAGALKNAGFENGEGLDKNKVGVVLGNSLNGEFTRANLMRGRWPYVFKVLASTLESLDFTQEDISRILSGTEKVYKAPFPDPDADMLAGGLSNTIAGRICNYFDFHGGGFTVDGACSSSLLSFQNGCNALTNGEMDVVLVGGVDLSIDPFEIIGFARNGALALNEMEVYSSRSAGFWPGEGCGVVVLMRASEAIERKLNIYALIKGWGISSDGNGGITRPKSETQQMAYDRAYERAGYGIDTVGMFEGHGTGTTLGDQVELTAIVNSLRSAGKKGDPAIVGSVKHLIGHTKAAAGIAGVIKTALAVKNGIIPPSRPTSTPNKILVEHADILKLTKTPTLWQGKMPLRASVMSMGFGGINVHLTMEEAALAKRPKHLPGKVSKLSESLRDTEIFPVSAASATSFQQQLERLRIIARDISRAEFIDLSATLSASFEDAGAWKASIVAATPDIFQENLDILLQQIKENKSRFIDTDKGIYFDSEGRPGKIGFLFPGQGAPVYQDAGAFSYFIKEQWNAVDGEKLLPGEVADTSKAQPSIVRNTLRSVELLEQLGVEAEWGIGNSLGEINALSWAGVMDDDTAIEVAKARGAVMSQYGEKGGAMLAVKCSPDDLNSLLNSKDVSVTGYNGYENYVIGGPVQKIDEVQQLAAQRGIHNVKLKVSHAFHTPMMKNAAIQFQEHLKNWEFGPVSKTVYSTVTGEKLEPCVNIAELLFTQIEAPVQFTQAIEHVKENTDFLIEVGPGNALTRTLSGYKNFHLLALDFGSQSLKGLYHILSAAFISGRNIQFGELSVNRFYRHFDVENWKLDVLVSPCEKIEYNGSSIKNLIQAEPAVAAGAPSANSTTHDAAAPASTLEGIESFIKKIISEKTEIPTELIAGDNRIMSQLHINSLAITEIISVVIKTFNKSPKVSSEASILANGDGTIHELSMLIFKGEAGNGLQADRGNVSLDQLPNWTHIFQRKNIAKKASKVAIDNGAGKIIAGGLKSIAAEWEVKLAQQNLSVGNGSVFVTSQETANEQLGDFVSFLNKPEVRQGSFIVLVTLQSPAATGDLRPVLRTFQQEVPQVSAMSIDIDSSLADQLQLLIAELKVISKYKEVVYDAQGNRFQSQCEVYFPAPGKLKDTIQEGDVILATGGGKGITFESVFDLAVSTGARVVIIGRSLPEKDSELSSNLKRISDAGITYRYYAADVCNRDSVNQAVLQAIAELGAIRVVIHGAGINKPKTLNNLTPADFQNTLSVKLEGLRNVIDSVDTSALKLVIGYGSIIAESGMEGNADYAYANDQLALYIDQLSTTLKNCRCLTLEWAVWDETGMGVTLNSIERLKTKGVYPIPVKKGIEILKAIIADGSSNGIRYIVSGRYGEIPTLNYAKKQLPTGRFISKIKHHVPGVEVVSEVNINVNDDIYLKNHVFQNQYVFPTVMILEGMAQVCSVLYPASPFWLFEDLKINKSIFIPSQGSNIVRFVVTRISEKSFKAVVQSEDSTFSVNCFEATINLASTPDFKSATDGYSKLRHLDFNVEEKFYDDLLFHHGPFRRINSFFKIQALESLAKADSNTTDPWFAASLPNSYVLGDPGLNDAAIHCHQACRPAYSLLPTGAAQIAINSQDLKGPFFIKTIENREENNDTIIDVFVMNAEGEIKMFWKDLRLTQVTGTSFKGQWDSHLLVPYIEYKLMKLSNSRSMEFPLQNCLELVNALSTDDKPQDFTINGYSISMRKVKDTGNGKPIHVNGNGATAPPQSNKLFEIHLANFKEKVLLHISEPAEIEQGQAA